MTETLLDVLWIVWHTSLCFCTMICIKQWCSPTITEKKVPIYSSSLNGWFDIKKHPVPENNEYFFLSDGDKVDFSISPRYNAKGQICFGFDKRIATHWMLEPNPPVK